MQDPNLEPPRFTQIDAEPRDKRSDERSQQALQTTLRMMKELGSSEMERDAAIAQNILHEELGYHGPLTRPPYNLDEYTRDVLLAHARQDASHAVIAAMTTQRLLGKALFWLKVFTGLAALALLSIWWKS